MFYPTSYSLLLLLIFTWVDAGHIRKTTPSKQLKKLREEQDVYDRFLRHLSDETSSSKHSPPPSTLNKPLNQRPPIGSEFSSSFPSKKDIQWSILSTVGPKHSHEKSSTTATPKPAALKTSASTWTTVSETDATPPPPPIRSIKSHPVVEEEEEDDDDVDFQPAVSLHNALKNVPMHITSAAAPVPDQQTASSSSSSSIVTPKNNKLNQDQAKKKRKFSSELEQIVLQAEEKYHAKAFAMSGSLLEVQETNMSSSNNVSMLDKFDVDLQKYQQKLNSSTTLCEESKVNLTNSTDQWHQSASIVMEHLATVEQNFAEGIKDTENLDVDATMKSTVNSLNERAITTELRKEKDMNEKLSKKLCEKKNQVTKNFNRFIDEKLSVLQGHSKQLEATLQTTEKDFHELLDTVKLLTQHVQKMQESGMTEGLEKKMSSTEKAIHAAVVGKQWLNGLKERKKELELEMEKVLEAAGRPTGNKMEKEIVEEEAVTVGDSWETLKLKKLHEESIAKTSEADTTLENVEVALKAAGLSNVTKEIEEIETTKNI